MVTVGLDDYNRSGSHVDFPGEQSVLYGWRVANHSDGEQVKRQFYGRPMEPSPEIRLLLAIFERALADLDIPQDLVWHRLARSSAMRWVMAYDDGPFAFCWVCEMLGWNAQYIRVGIMRRTTDHGSTGRRRTE